MRRFWVLLLVVLMVLTTAATAGAKVDCEARPDHPQCPNDPGGDAGGPNQPPLCDPSKPFVELPEEYSPYEVIVVGGKVRVTSWDGLIPSTELISRTEPDLCVKVQLVSGGPLSDMNVALVDYPDRAARRCGFYWPGWKMKSGDVFEVGFSLDARHYDGVDFLAGDPGYCGSSVVDDPDGDLSVLVQPETHPQADGALLTVRLGFGTLLP